MKKFLTRITVFAAIILAFLTLGEFVARRIPNSYSYKNQFITQHGDAISTLVLGSSHTYYGIKSDLLGDSVFNLANVSQTPDLDLDLLKYYESRLKNLKRIIIPVSYFTFVDPQLEDTPEWFRCIGYKVSMGLPKHSDFSRYNFEIADFEGYSAKLRGLLLRTASNKCDSLGWGLGFSVSERAGGWENLGKERAEATTIHVSARADEVEKILGEIITCCRQRGVESVLVTTPVWSSYRDNLAPTQLSDMKHRVSRIVDTYHVAYFNEFDSQGYDADDFHDVDHLSDVGAEKFTTRLRDFIAK